MSVGAASVHLRRHLIHNCVIERGSATRSTTSGEVAYVYTSQGSFDCRYVERNERIADEGAALQMMEETRLMLPNGTDIQEQDRVTDITLKSSGSAIEPGPMYVEELIKRNSTGPHHIWVKLERIE